MNGAIHADGNQAVARWAKRNTAIANRQRITPADFDQNDVTDSCKVWGNRLAQHIARQRHQATMTLQGAQRLLFCAMPAQACRDRIDATHRLYAVGSKCRTIIGAPNERLIASLRNEALESKLPIAQSCWRVHL